MRRCALRKDLMRCFGAISGGVISLLPALSMRVNGVVFPLTHIPTSYAFLCCDWLRALEYELLANLSTGGPGCRQAREAGSAGVRVRKKENNASQCV